MSAPDLSAPQRGDTNAWDEAFPWLWPTAFSVAQLKLQPYLPEDIEDVAIEALEELVEKARQIKQIEEQTARQDAVFAVPASVISATGLAIAVEGGVAWSKLWVLEYERWPFKACRKSPWVVLIDSRKAP